MLLEPPGDRGRRARRRSTDDDRAMNSDELRDYLLSFTGAEETFLFNPETSVFKVG